MSPSKASPPAYASTIISEPPDSLSDGRNGETITLVIGAMFNQTILGKWLLCIEWEDGSLGKLVVVSQFGIGPGGWFTILGRLLFETKMWKGIAKDCENFEHTGLWWG